MKTKVFLVLAIFLLLHSCKNQDKGLNVKILETPFEFNRKSPHYTRDGILLDKSTFTDTTFKELKVDRLFSIAKLNIKNAHTTLLINEDPSESWTGTFYLINYSEKQKPISYMFLYDYGSDIIKTTITKDTIYKLITYNYSDWVEKYIVSDEGKFILVEEKKVWADTTYEPH